MFNPLTGLMSGNMRQDKRGDSNIDTLNVQTIDADNVNAKYVNVTNLNISSSLPNVTNLTVTEKGWIEKLSSSEIVSGSISTDSLNVVQKLSCNEMEVHKSLKVEGVSSLKQVLSSQIESESASIRNLNGENVVVKQELNVEKTGKIQSLLCDNIDSKRIAGDSLDIRGSINMNDLTIKNNLEVQGISNLKKIKSERLELSQASPSFDGVMQVSGVAYFSPGGIVADGVHVSKELEVGGIAKIDRILCKNEIRSNGVSTSSLTSRSVEAVDLSATEIIVTGGDIVFKNDSSEATHNIVGANKITADVVTSNVVNTGDSKADSFTLKGTNYRFMNSGAISSSNIVNEGHLKTRTFECDNFKANQSLTGKVSCESISTNNNDINMGSGSLNVGRVNGYFYLASMRAAGGRFSLICNESSVSEHRVDSITESLTSVCYGEGYFIATTGKESIPIVFSADGITWKQSRSVISGFNPSPSWISYLKGYFIAGGYGKNNLAYIQGVNGIINGGRSWVNTAQLFISGSMYQSYGITFSPSLQTWIVVGTNDGSGSGYTMAFSKSDSPSSFTPCNKFRNGAEAFGNTGLGVMWCQSINLFISYGISTNRYPRLNLAFSADGDIFRTFESPFTHETICVAYNNNNNTLLCAGNEVGTYTAVNPVATSLFVSTDFNTIYRLTYTNIPLTNIDKNMKKIFSLSFSTNRFWLTSDVGIFNSQDCLKWNVYYSTGGSSSFSSFVLGCNSYFNQLEVDGQCTLNNGISVNGRAKVNGGIIVDNGRCKFNTGIEVNGTTEINGEVRINPIGTQETIIGGGGNYTRFKGNVSIENGLTIAKGMMVNGLLSSYSFGTQTITEKYENIGGIMDVNSVYAVYIMSLSTRGDGTYAYGHFCCWQNTFFPSSMNNILLQFAPENPGLRCRSANGMTYNIKFNFIRVL